MEKISKFDILVCPYSIKKKMLKQNHFLNVKYMSLEEFKNKYLFEYRSDTLYYLVKKYNLLPEIACTIMNNLYYLKNINSKLHQLVEIKNDLETNHYLIFNYNFKMYIKNKKIAIDYPNTKENQLLFKDLNYVYLKEGKIERKIPIYEFPDIEDEVIFVASKITDLLLKGININQIKIVKSEEVYTGVLNRIFSLFKIPFSVDKVSLYNLTEIREILKELDFNQSVSEIVEIVKEKTIDSDIKNSLLQILSKYLSLNPKMKDFYSVFVYELQHTKVSYHYIDTVKEITIDDIEIDNYTFILGFNQDIFPKYYDDDSYLSDKEYLELGLDSSLDKNVFLKEKIINLLHYPNIYLTYKLKTPFQQYTISNLCEELDYEIIKPEYDFSNIQINQLLLATKLDEYLKYNVKDDTLDELYGSLEIPYGTYDNRYKIINNSLLKNRIMNLNLSFSNIDVFYKCQFRFYLENILKIKKEKSTISLEIGNLFHIVLERYYKEKSDIETIIDTVLNQEELNPKQLFYRKKYKKLLLDLITIMDEQLKNTDYDGKYFEKWFSVIKDNDLNIKVVGKIDKIMIFSDSIHNYVVVIDYKTGALHADFNKVIHGMDMQLLIYLYLIKNTDLIKNPVFTGMYLEPIFTNVLKSDNNKTYQELLRCEYKWVGYTLKNTEYLRNIDKNYETNSFIHGIKVKSDGSFYSYSKVLTESNLNELLSIVDKNIDFVIKSIKASDFRINPKRIGKNNVSCPFCPYQDICYKTNHDYVNLKEYRDLEFLDEEVSDET